MFGHAFTQLFCLMVILTQSTGDRPTHVTRDTVEDSLLVLQCRTDSTNEAIVYNCSSAFKGNNDIQFNNKLPAGVTGLDLSFNNLTYIPHFVLKGSLSNLMMLNMSGNNYNTNSIDDFLLEVNPTQLVELDLSNNQLDQVPKGIQRVEHLNLNSNHLSKLIVAELSTFVKLKALHLQGNAIKSLQADCRESMKLTVRWLDLSQNGLAEIGSDSFCQMNLLTHLNLSHNRIELIEKNTLSSLRLGKLDLSYNNLKVIPVGMFKKCLELNYLDLSHNRLITLPSNLPMMDWLDVSYNRIRTVPEAQSTLLYPQTVFLIGGNPFLCDCDLLWLKELYDTRSYLLQYLIHLDKSKFIPVCAEPYPLRGESWDSLRDDSFECQGLAEEDMKLTNEKIEDILGEQVDGLSAVVIGPDFVELSLNVKLTTLESASYLIHYHKFGEKPARKEVILPTTVSRYKLKGLIASSPYIVCLSTVVGSVPEQHNCVEVMTLTDDSNYIYLFISSPYCLIPFVGFILGLICVFIIKNIFRKHVKTHSKKE